MKKKSCLITKKMHPKLYEAINYNHELFAKKAGIPKEKLRIKSDIQELIAERIIKDPFVPTFERHKKKRRFIIEI